MPAESTRLGMRSAWSKARWLCSTFSCCEIFCRSGLALSARVRRSFSTSEPGRESSGVCKSQSVEGGSFSNVLKSLRATFSSCCATWSSASQAQADDQVGLENFDLRDVAGLKTCLGNIVEALGKFESIVLLRSGAARESKSEESAADVLASGTLQCRNVVVCQRTLRLRELDAVLALAAQVDGLIEPPALMRVVAKHVDVTGGIGAFFGDLHAGSSDGALSAGGNQVEILAFGHLQRVCESNFLRLLRKSGERRAEKSAKCQSADRGCDPCGGASAQTKWFLRMKKSYHPRQV